MLFFVHFLHLFTFPPPGLSRYILLSWTFQSQDHVLGADEDCSFIKVLYFWDWILYTVRVLWHTVIRFVVLTVWFAVQLLSVFSAFCVHDDCTPCFVDIKGDVVTECQALWNKALDVVKATTSVSVFQSFFSVVTPLSFTSDRLVIQVDSPIVADWMKQNCAALIEKSLSGECGRKILLVIQCNTDASAFSSASAQPPEPASATHAPISLKFQHTLATTLNPNQTFATFVVGGSNQMAHAAAYAVSQHPGRTYNPLFIYGGVGLGKTHLMQAIGNAVIARDSRKHIHYLSCERFVNQFIESIQKNTEVKFRSFYRSNVDVLLIDDIQFLRGKEATQEEFFHTFNALHQEGKQIVMTSDKSPQELQHIESRLLNRFEWGMVADIQSPEFETRVAIIHKKLENLGITLDDDVCNYVALKVQNDVRRIEGALIKLVAYATLQNRTATLEFAKECLKDYISGQAVSLELIQKVVSDFFDLRLTDMRSNRRPKAIAHPRQLAMYLCRGLTSSSLSEIAQSFGGRDHTTVLYACRKIDMLKTADEAVAQQLEVLKRRVVDATTKM